MDCTTIFAGAVKCDSDSDPFITHLGSEMTDALIGDLVGTTDSLLDISTRWAAALTSVADGTILAFDSRTLNYKDSKIQTSVLSRQFCQKHSNP